MDRRTTGIALLIIGVLAFLWATSQISNLPPAMLTPQALQDQLINGPMRMYRIVQVVSTLAAVGGGVLLFSSRATT